MQPEPGMPARKNSNTEAPLKQAPLPQSVGAAPASGDKLVDDCFLTNRPSLTHGEALAIFRQRIVGVASSERLPLGELSGRILAEPITAHVPVPAHTNSAVDGYAFASASYDRKDGSAFPVVGRATAGHALTERIATGGAVRIFTGAVIPADLDTVAMQEDCTASNDTVRIPGGLKPRANVRSAGEDVAAGTRLFEPGHILRPQDLGALASIGCAEAACYRRLRVALVSSGDEVVRPGGSTALLSGQVFDANGPLLAGLATLAGAEIHDLGVWPDDINVMTRKLADAATHYDLILTTGGASKGEEDHMASAIDQLGKRHLWQIAIKPGRPIMFGQIGAGDRQTVIVGLPGNPVAVFVCFLMYVFPMIRALGGAPWREPRRYQLPTTFAFKGRKPGRREFWRGMLVDGPGGQLSVDKFARDGSGLISGLRAADGLIDIPEDHGDVAVGDLVSFIPFTEFGIV
jgi:molybdopterin molybdotransferase